ncbi:hypothetical protein IV38_GL001920 [Lactobacillus selangorensis]|uniref:Uncharacterized protein n=1 Tax=Lactobacillus selangorensis TaxID=81857 RepID=A0A0R2FPE9_9LACO|nr:SP_1767 family glycosyltransferase [Lactobacillus selangorensis]KRN27707.1 hypothetical protein IV38_GL001920 [Lactobacillus selangorensis]KRN30328.1 hypothetical protein IV40_GL001917 [Lactobacillus selangorensis]
MTKWVTKIIPAKNEPASLKKETDFATIAHTMGYQYVNIERYDRQNESYQALGAHIEGMTAAVEKGDLLIYQYPSGIDDQFEVSFTEHVVYRGVHFVPVVQDYRRLHFGYNPGFDEVRLFNMACAVVVPTAAMRDQMRNDGVKTPIILQTGWDFLTKRDFDDTLPERAVTLLGNFEHQTLLQDWTQHTDLIAVGKINPEQTAEKVSAEPAANLAQAVQKLTNTFGIAWQGSDYTSYNLPYEVFAYLGMGMPVFVWSDSAIAALVSAYQVGYVIQTRQEIDQILDTLSDEDLQQLQKRVQHFAILLRNGFFTRKLLIEVEETVAANVLNVSTNVLPPVQVMGIHATLTFIKENHASVVRFGDGEFDLIRGKSIPYQDYDPELAQQLANLLASPSSDQLLICIPDVFQNLNRYQKSVQRFYKNRFSNQKFVKSRIATDSIHGSTFISRPYMDLADKTPAKNYFADLKDRWYGRDILIVEGKYTRSGIGNDLFADAHTIERILCPARNAYQKKAAIEAAIKKYGQHKLVLLMLGPTAKVIVGDLYRQENWLIDIGHIDSEYEWFKMGATTKVVLPNKHTAEHNFDENVTDHIDDPIFKQQVLVDLSD